jgi:hypothetical protein
MIMVAVSGWKKINPMNSEYGASIGQEYTGHRPGTG